jgi:hypothetical protein
MDGYLLIVGTLWNFVKKIDGWFWLKWKAQQDKKTQSR